jgi:hypothetical protein
MNLPKLTAEQSLGITLGNYITRILPVEVSSEVKTQEETSCGCSSKAACSCNSQHYKGFY